MVLMVGVSPEKPTARINESWRFIMENLKLISNKSRRSNMRFLLQSYKPAFLVQPASVKHHHNKVGGLVVHTAQVLKSALKIHKEYKKHLPKITSENVYIACVLHDLSKTQLYERVDSEYPPSNHPYPFTYNKKWGRMYEHDMWTLSKANLYDLRLTYDEIMGIVQAHGGWAKLNDPINKLAVVVHCADMLSSQLIKK